MSDAHRDAEVQAYDNFARRVVAGKVLTDPWSDGRPRFREEPLFITTEERQAMYRAAEAVAEVYNELCLIVCDHPELLDDFFGLTPFQKAMWHASAPLWHGLARADVFITEEGLAFAELNCDTPTGEAEAVVLNACVAADHPTSQDPNVGLKKRFLAMVETLAARELGASPEGTRRGRKTVVIVYPTEMTDDLALVRLYRSWFQEAGYEVVLGSPYNLSVKDDALCLFDTPFSLLVRHYKTDWWGERIAAWDDAVIPDVLPLTEPLRAVLEGSLSGHVSIVNPFGAVLPQNKRSMAFMWEHIHRFSPRAAEVIRRHIPVTSRLETMHEEQLLAAREEWVLKSDYGAEGDEVIVGRRVTDEIWRASLAHARPGHWVAQRYFAARAGANAEVVNYGIYLIAGEASGVYARVQDGPTDERALSVPVLVKALAGKPSAQANA